MKLFITDSIFISVIEQENKTFDCLIMEEIHGIGMDSASITESDEDREDVVSSVYISPNSKIKFSECKKICTTLNDLSLYHRQCMKEYYQQN